MILFVYKMKKKKIFANAFSIFKKWGTKNT